MPLEAPVVGVLKKGPQGADTVAVFLSANLKLTYWDFWCVLSAKHRFDVSLPNLRESLVERRLLGRSWSMSQTELLEDLIALTDDLIERIEGAHTSVDEILQRLPESLLKKEMQKGIKNITSDSGSYNPPSEPMLSSPRRLLAADSEVFLKDLIMFLCWENYGLLGPDAIADYVCRLQPHDARLAIQILKDIHHRASQGFQIYNAKIAARALKKLETLRILPKLTLVRPTRDLSTELS